MRILFLHTFYQQPGGEDVMFRSEVALMAEHDHAVSSLTLSNESLGGMSIAATAVAVMWNASVYRRVRQALKETRPDVAHFHNTFPLASVSAYAAARAEGVPVVQTVHNYRLVCPKATCFREGRPCEDCVGRTFAWPAVVHACYRQSRLTSGAAAVAVAVLRRADAKARLVERYVALTHFAKEMLVAGGVPRERIAVVPNFAPDIPRACERSPSDPFGLFVGRLDEEKGLDTLLSAWKEIEVPLQVFGDGPLLGRLRGQAPANVRLLGRRSATEIRDAMAKATFLLVPSVWYEGFPMVVIEAYRQGLPVIVSRLGSLAEVVEDGVTGMLFDAGNVEDLVRATKWALKHPEALSVMGRGGRRRYQERYMAEAHYQALMRVYRSAVEARTGESTMRIAIESPTREEGDRQRRAGYSS
jgi:glycosyltransferase involved in cell wall biosynthesis